MEAQEEEGEQQEQERPCRLWACSLSPPSLDVFTPGQGPRRALGGYTCKDVRDRSWAERAAAEASAGPIRSSGAGMDL